MQVPAERQSYTVRKEQSASLLLVVEGRGSVSRSSDELQRGVVLFISANTEVCINVDSSLLMFRAYCSQ